MDYIEDVSERFLRHVEVKRHQALRFRTESVPADASCLLEQLRFTLGMLDMAKLFQDIRYFNAALKLNDWHYKSIRKIKLPRDLGNEKLTNLMVVLHYISSIAEQESFLREWLKNESGNTGAH